MNLYKFFMWSLFHKEKELKPLVFSNGKSQKDIVKEVIDLVNQGNKIIFIKGVCGTGKSAIALNLAKEFGRASIIVPIKSLQEQYIKDYTEHKYVLKNSKKLKICSIAGRQNFKCKFLQETNYDFEFKKKETNSKIFDIFESKPENPETNTSCDNHYIPCKIEIKERNMGLLKNYIRENPAVNLRDFNSIKDIKRFSIAPVCAYWSPILPAALESKKLENSRKLNYTGLEDNSFAIHQRKPGCPYYEQYQAYLDADVIIFNALKYKIESLMNRKPNTDIEIIDECDDFLDSFSNQEQISINKLLFSLPYISSNDEQDRETQKQLFDLANSIKNSPKYKDILENEIFELKDSRILELLELVLENPHLIESFEDQDSNYLAHLYEVAAIFRDFFNETYFSIEKKDNDFILRLVTTNLAKRFDDLIVKKNKIIIMMSGTIHSESVLKNIFGINNFKIIEAETKPQGELIKCKHGYEMDCKYSNFQSKKITREKYLFALSKAVSCAKKPILVHVNSFSDLPNEKEKQAFNLDNLPTQNELIQEQNQDPFGEKVKKFKQGKIDTLFTTKCSRGIDFPGEVCNSIIITRFPYPNISSIFWKILKKTYPAHFMSFYMDKANREVLQKVYRGLRSKDDKVYLLSPDIRVLDFKFN
jgi:Rad3-related DNA helicase